MMLHVLSTGPLVSVQDCGRPGLRRFGVSAAGPMDAPALALANALCGNPPEAAVLEFAASGGRFRAERPVRVAVTGGACDMRIDGRIVAANECHRLEVGEELSVGALKDTAWGYIAVSGGIATAPVMGGRSTHLRFGLGGLDGRALQAGDALPLGDAMGEDVLLRPSSTLAAPRHGDPIRVMLGPQDGYFSEDILQRLSGATFAVTARRDRMATILDGPDMPAARGHDIISDGTMPGAIQVPGSGKPMVLMAECQTTGGYPKIATVISADLLRFAQMPTGTQIRFAVVDRTTAEAAARKQHQALCALLEGLVRKPEGALSSEYLLSCDLVGGIHDPAAIVGGRMT